jgi:hypothetical protein
VPFVAEIATVSITCWPGMTDELLAVIVTSGGLPS